MDFSELFESVKQRESKSMIAIRNGIGIRDNFWNDFLLLLNNSEAVSELFGVPIDRVSTWKNKINHSLNMVKKSDETIITKEKGKLLKTGLPDKSQLPTRYI